MELTDQLLFPLEMGLVTIHTFQFWFTDQFTDQLQFPLEMF